MEVSGKNNEFRVINIGDQMVFSLKDIKKTFNEDHNSNIDGEKLNKESADLLIAYCEQHNVCYLRATLEKDQNDHVFFKQEFLDEEYQNLNLDVGVRDSFILHLDHVCPSKSSFYSGQLSDIQAPFSRNGVDLLDGDLWCAPISSLKNCDPKIFSDEFNAQIDEAIKFGIKNIVFSMHYNLHNRKNAGDDLSGYMQGKDDKYNYSQINFNCLPIIRMFLTNEWGEIVCSLSDFKTDPSDGKIYINDLGEQARNSFMTEDVTEEYNKKCLSFITVLRENAFFNLTSSQAFVENMELIGNYHSDEYNFTSIYDMITNFKKHQQAKRVDLEEVKAILIHKQDLPEYEKIKMQADSTHIMLAPLKNEHDERYTNLIKTEIVFGHNEKILNQETIDVYAFNQLLKDSENIKIFKDKNYLPREKLKSEYDVYGQFVVNDENNPVNINGVLRHNVYHVSTEQILNALSDKAKTSAALITKLEELKKIGISQFLFNVACPNYFVHSDQKLENNELVYIDRRRFPEIRLYPLCDETMKFVDLKLLTLIDNNEKTPAQVKHLSETLFGSQHLGILNKVYNPISNIKLNTAETLSLIYKCGDELKASPSYNQNRSLAGYSALDAYFLKLICKRIVVPENEKSHVSKPSIKIRL